MEGMVEWTMVGQVDQLLSSCKRDNQNSPKNENVIIIYLDVVVQLYDFLLRNIFIFPVHVEINT